MFLARLSVTVHSDSLVEDIRPDRVTIEAKKRLKRSVAVRFCGLRGVRASCLGQLAEKAGAQIDRAGRVMVEPDLTVPGHPEIFVIGDVAHARGAGGNPCRE